MLACIACTKQSAEKEGGRARDRSGVPRTKEAVKSLTAQIKDVAFRFSGAYRQCKPCPGSSCYKKGQVPYPDLDEGVPYPYFTAGVCSSSNPPCDFERSNHQPRSTSLDAVVFEEEKEPKEWMAQVEPGIHITFVSLPNGGNDLKRIRFSREMFDKWQAQRWWVENYDRILELYNVQRFNHQALHTTPSRSEHERNFYSRLGPAREISPMVDPSVYKRTCYKPSGCKLGCSPHDHLDQSTCHQFYPGSSAYGAQGPSAEPPCFERSLATTDSSKDEPSVSSVGNGCVIEAEWTEQDEPGVYITVRQSDDGTRELRRVRFSRERFGEVHAKLWWEQNRERIQVQYLEGFATHTGGISNFASQKY